MTVVKKIYRVIRSVLFASIITVGAVLVLLYVLLSIPAVQNSLRKEAVSQLSEFLHSPVSIEKIDFSPFNELQLNNVEIRTPDNQPCIQIQRLGAGIALWKLVARGQIEITYVELLGLKGRIAQKEKDSPLNIQFIIDALKPKEEGKPPTRFDLKLQNIVIRKSSLRFDREWMPASDKMPFDVNHLAVYNLRADVALPRLSNDDIQVDLRRLSFNEKSGLYVDAITCQANISPKEISIKDFSLKLNNSLISLNDQAIRFNGYSNLLSSLQHQDLHIQLKGRDLTPSDFGFLNASLRQIPGNYNLNLDAEGDFNDITIRKFIFESAGTDDLNLSFSGNLNGLKYKEIRGTVSDMDFGMDASLLCQVLDILPGMKENAKSIVASTGYIQAQFDGGYNGQNSSAFLKGDVQTVQGGVNLDGSLNWQGNFQHLAGNLKVSTDQFDLISMLPNQPVSSVIADAEAEFFITGRDIKCLDGNLTANVPLIVINGHDITGVNIEGEKAGKEIHLRAEANSAAAYGDVLADCILDGPASEWNISGAISNLNLSDFHLLPKYPAAVSIQSFDIAATGNTIDNIEGVADISGLQVNPLQAQPWHLNRLHLLATENEGFRTFNIDSDVLKGDISGNFKVNDVKQMGMEILSYTLPSYIEHPLTAPNPDTDIRFVLIVNNDTDLFEAFNMKYMPITPINLEGEMKDNKITLDVDAPYIRKGNDKLIKNLALHLTSDRAEGSDLKIKGSLPVKKGYVELDVNSTALENRISNDIAWKFDYNDDKGQILLDVDIDRQNGSAPVFDFNFKESALTFNNAQWKLSPAHAIFSDKILSVDNLRVSGDNQYVNISGRASANPMDTIKAELNDIDLAYIFNTLNINYVTFGGRATGTAIATNIFSKEPVAKTQGLHVTDFSYNGANVGDADLLGFWDNTRKSVGIGAHIYNTLPDGSLFTRGKVKGDIFVTRDSLGINFDVNKINIALIQPFLSNVMEHVEGEATADLTLYGNFKNISLVGKAFADTAAIKLGFTNVTYYGSDSVLFTKDAIIVPGFKVYDRYGHSALFSGNVKHNYFHDAKVDFDIKNVKNLLAYDTDASSGDIWYGKIFASGSGRVHGVPGYTNLNFNVTTNPNSMFTFVLDETETASEYSFLTFTDKSKHLHEVVTIEDIEEEFRRKLNQATTDDYSVLDMDIAVAINPGLKVNVIMDPSSGDKIEARGNGAMRLHYDTSSDEVDIFGRYVLDEGSYRFRFQDLILRDFTIRPGSTISFNGDPLRGILDLTAAYRVNTNLTDLDKSFATDRDLNRSSVPVDALLKVSGELTSPDIDFDISFPTVTAEVERKVRSIISSEEMMQQQVLYLLALNRFYTPQFAGSSDGELMSVASSTLSSQVANVLSQITDKVSLNPSFKSDRSDLSDMEVDLALSSQLFDNRLIINGNLGYRDRSVSQTNFIGDFDIEYLLSKDGRLRLKAYNHFNDAYYYLKSALTTQGVGIIYRKDFDDAFSFLRPKKRKKVIKVPVTQPRDTTASPSSTQQ